MRTAMLIRTGSFPAQTQAVVGSPRGSAADLDSGAGISFLRRSPSTNVNARSALHLDAKQVGGKISMSMSSPSNSIRRARSDTDLIESERSSGIGSRWSPPVRVAEEDEEDRRVSGRVWREAAMEELEVEYSGGGMGKGRKIGGGSGGGGGGEGGDQNQNRRMGNYYQEMLRADPGNPLLLRNYGRFLHEVEGDVKGAEECYGRAILASPGDGDVLSLYGKLVWEAHRDGEKAGDYFQRAVEASPDDCYVLGSYAHFLWDAEEEEEEEGRVASASASSSSSPLVEAF